MEEGIAAQRAHCQSHQKGEQELEAGLIEDGHQNDAQQRQQADHGDGHKAPHPDPYCNNKSKYSVLLKCKLDQLDAM